MVKTINIKTVDLSKALQDYSNVWLALEPTTMSIVSVGKKFSTVLNKARRMGVKDPVLTRAPKDYGAYIL